MVNSSLAKKSLVLWFVALALLFAFIPQRVHACSCGPVGSPADALARASAVFSGKVINRQRVSLTLYSALPEQFVMSPEQVTFDVAQVWKGPVFPTLAVYSALCGYEFPDDGEYLVYAFANGEEENLLVTFCSRTRPLAEAAEDLSALGEGMIPMEENLALLSPLVSPLSPSSPLTAGGNSSPPTCLLPVALVGMLGMLSTSARMRGARQSRRKYA